MGKLEEPTLGYRLRSGALHWLTRTVRFLDGSARAHLGWDPYLKGMFAPVFNEVHEEGLEVLEGALPADLAGAFIRTGPNPKLPVEGGYHWFDGDGMTHTVRISGGKASYCNRWVLTERLAQEEKAGWAAFTKIGDFRGLAALAHMFLRKLACLLGVVSYEGGRGTANTALAFHAGRVLALHEGDLPYALRIACSGLTETVERVTFDGKVGHAFTAHPKIDAQTGECFYFGYSVETAPYCWFGRLDKQGRVVADFPVPLPQPIMMHDMALTQRYALLLDVPLVFDPKAMIKKGQLPFTFESRPARIGVLPRYATSADEIRWFDTENMMCFHTACAWEDGPSTIRLYLCAFATFSLDAMTAKEGSEPYLTEVTLDLDSGDASVRRLPGAAPGDFPVVPPSCMGHPCRYTYVATMQPDERGTPLFTGVTKYDLQAAGGGGGGSAVVGQVQHGRRRFGGEAVFAPKGGGTAEDDGYLLTYVTDETTAQSELAIYSAKTMSSQPVCRLRLPQRVPMGFHGTWVSAAQLAEQRA